MVWWTYHNHFDAFSFLLHPFEDSSRSRSGPVTLINWICEMMVALEANSEKLITSSRYRCSEAAKSITRVTEDRIAEGNSICTAHNCFSFFPLVEPARNNNLESDYLHTLPRSSRIHPFCSTAYLLTSNSLAAELGSRDPR